MNTAQVALLLYGPHTAHLVRAACGTGRRIRGRYLLAERYAFARKDRLAIALFTAVHVPFILWGLGVWATEHIRFRRSR